MKQPIQVLAGPRFSIIFFKKVEDEVKRQEMSFYRGETVGWHRYALKHIV
jgi:hypothetical protein